MPKLFALCVPFIDITINNTDILDRVKIGNNTMTPYTQLEEKEKEYLNSYLDDKKDIFVTYGGNVYNTCMHIAKRKGKTKAVFIGPFSTHPISKEVVFKDTLMGKEPKLIIIPEMLDTEPGVCIIIPNSVNRAIITRINPDLCLSASLCKVLIDRLMEEESKKRASFVYVSGYTVESSPDILLVAEEKIKKKIKCTLFFNLSDPGVIIRSYKAIKPFIKCSNWVIGNINEFLALYMAKTKKEASSPAAMYREIHGILNTNILISNGADRTVAIYEEQGEVKEASIVPSPIEVKNTNGAGDSFAAEFIASLLEDKSVQEALSRATHSASRFLTRTSPHGN
ncbi:adenosine kinase [Nematocida sp. LUAm2]|nr:adenosine kinase [Nematocida sp. LUAm2]